MDRKRKCTREYDVMSESEVSDLCLKILIVKRNMKVIPGNAEGHEEEGAKWKAYSII